MTRMKTALAMLFAGLLAAPTGLAAQPAGSFSDVDIYTAFVDFPGAGGIPAMLTLTGSDKVNKTFGVLAFKSPWSCSVTFHYSGDRDGGRAYAVYSADPRTPCEQYRAGSVVVKPYPGDALQVQLPGGPAFVMRPIKR